MWEIVKSIVDSVGFVGFLLLMLYAIWSYYYGRTGFSDMAFFITRLYPAEEGNRRCIELCTVGSMGLEDVIGNQYLRLRLTFHLFFSRRGVLSLKKEMFRNRIMSEFRHTFSALINQDEAAHWANREDTAPSTIKYQFSISDLHSINQRKIRIIALRKKDIEWIRTNGVAMVEIPIEIAFMEAVMTEMTQNADSIAGVTKVLAE